MRRTEQCTIISCFVRILFFCGIYSRQKTRGT
jgi:hypothetical protein